VISAQVTATQAPLYDILSSPRVKGSHPITWLLELLKAFEECKASLLRTILLAHSDPSTPLALITDAYTSAVGAMLQHVNNAWQPFTSTPPNRSTALMTMSYWPSTKL
jgi:hypothetical protein